MTKLHPDATINRISIYIRNELIDPYAGREIPDEVKYEVIEIFDTPRFRNKIYHGNEYAKVFVQILRQFRIDRIEEILHWHNS